MQQPLWLRALPLASLLLAFCFTSTSLAAHRDDARKHFQAGEFSKALDAASKALAEKPGDRPVQLVRALSLNRLGRHRAALSDFEQLQEAGLAYDGLLFEIGWAHMGLNNPAQAIVFLEAYEDKSPGEGQTSEFLGRCYFALGQYDKAKQLLAQAIERDESLKATATLYQAEINRRQGKPDAMAGYVRQIVTEDADSPLGRAFSEEFAAIGQRGGAKPYKPWRLTVSVGGGYNDNVAGLSNSLATPVTLPDRDGGFGRLSIFGSYDVFRDDTSVATVGYGFQGDWHGGEQDDVNLMDHYFYGEYSKLLNEKIMVGVRVADDYVNLGGDSFRNRITARPYGLYRLSENASIEFGYTVGVTEYFTATTTTTDRDELSHTLDATLYLTPQDSVIRAKFGVIGHWSDADGSDYDHTAISAFAGIESPIGLKFTGSILYIHTWRDFENPNSFLAFNKPRDDDSGTVRVQFTRPLELDMPGNARLYFMYEHVFQDSNVALFDFRQNVYSAGVIFDF